MKLKNTLKLLSIVISTIILTACGGGSSTPNDNLQKVVYEEQIDENITTNIELENISLIIPEDTVGSSTQLKIIESPESGGSASNIFDISSSSLLKRYVEMRLKVNDPSLYTEEDLVVVYQNEGDDTLHVNPSSYNGSELYTVTTHFSRWWAYPAAVLCATLGMGGEDERICTAVQKEPTTEKDCEARFPIGSTENDSADGSIISMLSEQCTDFTLPGECETCVIDKKQITGCLKGLIPASDGYCRAHECTEAQLGTTVTTYTDGTSDQCTLDKDGRRVLVEVCAEGFIDVDGSCMAHECTEAEIGTTREYTDGTGDQCIIDENDRRIWRPIDGCIEGFITVSDGSCMAHECTEAQLGTTIATYTDGSSDQCTLDDDNRRVIVTIPPELFPISIPANVSTLFNTDRVYIDLNGGSNTIAGWTVGGVDVGSNDGISDPNNEYSYFHLYGFEGPDSTQAYTFQTSNFTVTFYDAELNPVLSLRSEPLQFYQRYVPVADAVSIKYYRFTWTGN